MTYGVGSNPIVVEPTLCRLHHHLSGLMIAQGLILDVQRFVLASQFSLLMFQDCRQDYDKHRIYLFLI